MGDNVKLHNEEEWSWDDSEQDWDGTEDSVEKQRKKRIQRYRQKKIHQETTAKKAKHILGAGPISKDSINYFYDITADLELAKILAAREYLSEYLQYTEDEIKEIDIVETMTSSKEDDLLYITFADHDAIRDIHRRVAAVRNKDIVIRNFIPPQFWDRYVHLSDFCRELRSNNNNTKTLIRFNDNDLEVVTKDKKTDDNYQILPLNDIEKQGKIPKFNHSLVWKKRVDKPPRSKVEPVTTKVRPPSLRQNELLRHRSTDSNSAAAPAKKPRTENEPEVEEMVTAD